jgi:uncharacterized protein (DUF2147 family)
MPNRPPHRPAPRPAARAAALPRADRRPALLLALLAAALVAALLAAAGTAGAAEAGADAVLGTWLTEAGDQGGRARVEIRRRGDRFVGTIVSLEEPSFEAGHPRAGKPKVDLENPDPALRERPIVGLAILDGFTYDGDGTWSGGTIYDPANGKTYKAKMSLEGRDTLDVRGYVGVPLFGRTTTWKRID